MKKPLQIFTFSIQNQVDGSIDIHIDGDIVDASTQEIQRMWFGDTTSTSYKSFRDQVSKTSASLYNVYINSLGGHVGDAMAMHDLIVDMQNQGKIVNTIGRGIVASSATLILMAGKNPEMSANSWFMMHTVSGGIYGTVDQIENYSRTMRKFNNQVRDMYALKSGQRAEDITKLMDNETWLSAKEAKDKGFISKTTGDAAFTNLIPAENWAYSNTSILNSYNASVKPISADDSITNTMKKLFLDLKTEILNSIKGVKPAEGDDKQALINSIAEAVSAPFENVGTQIEAAVNTAIEDKIKAFENRVKTLEDAKIALEKRNTELSQEIENKLGQETIEKDPKNHVTPVGSFN